MHVLQFVHDKPEGLELGSGDSEGLLEVEPGDHLIAGGSGQPPGVGGEGHALTDGRGHQLVKTEGSQLLVTVRLGNTREGVSDGLQRSIFGLNIH